MLLPFRLSPVYRDYIWGGKKLRPAAEITAEAWILYEEDILMDGPYSGQSLASVVELEGEVALGSRVVNHNGTRFPLLIKLLDSSDWLSLQVHPNTRQAQEFAGPGNVGKTEAWYVLNAEDDARLICGFKPEVSFAQIRDQVGQKGIIDLVQYHKVQPGDTFFIAPGTIHALGPGLLIYEIQQNSDLTYRVYDWDRPRESGRKLHLAESLHVLSNPSPVDSTRKNQANGVQRKTLISCDFFALELLKPTHDYLAINLKGESFSVVTCVEHEVTITGKEWRYSLLPYETLFIPAACQEYTISSASEGQAMLAYC